MGNTAKLGLPYPENTDPLANIAAAVEALANAIDLGPATGDNLTTVANVTSGGVSWTAVGRVVTVNIAINSLSASLAAGSVLTVVTAANGIPPAWRPAVLKVGGIYAGNAVGFARINTDGSISIQASTGAMAGPYGTIVYTV